MWMGEKKRDANGVVKDGVYILFFSGCFLASHARCKIVGLCSSWATYSGYIFFEFE